MPSLFNVYSELYLLETSTKCGMQEIVSRPVPCGNPTLLSVSFVCVRSRVQHHGGNGESGPDLGAHHGRVPHHPAAAPQRHLRPQDPDAFLLHCPLGGAQGERVSSQLSFSSATRRCTLQILQPIPNRHFCVTANQWSRQL